MSRVIPKEQLTAYQRWELGSFDAGKPSPAPVVAAPPPPPEPEPILSVPLPTAEDLERIQREAWQEGFDLGHSEGRTAGYDEGFQEGNKDGQLHADRLHQLVEALQVESLRADENLAREVLDLSLNIAQQIIRSAVHVKPQNIILIIREALQSLPSLSGHHKIVVHPDDAGIVNDWLAKEHSHLSWRIIEDEQIAPGGFRFESAHNELDATLETRWREVTSCLGTDTSWLT